jgi:hypothetical protein
MGISYRKGHSGRPGFYDVLADGLYVGFVMKSGNGWENSTDVSRYTTRKGATDAMAPFIAAEVAAVTHFANATRESHEYDEAAYDASKAALFAAIRAAYPGMDVDNVYETWIDCGETIDYVVNALRTEAASEAKYAAELAEEERQYQARIAAREALEQQQAANDADERAEVARVQRAAGPVNTIRVERDVTIDISRDGVGFAVTMVAVFPEALNADGYTRAGTPFARVRVSYDSLEAARRMVDVMAAEFRSDASKVWAGFTVTLTGLASLSSRVSGEVRIREGGSFRGPVVASAPVATSYRAAGFPSLDAAVEAGYAVR